MRPRLILLAASLALAGIADGTFAQEKGTLDPVPLPPLANPDDPSTPAKQLFGRQVVPAALAARTIGFYSHGCLAGGEALPVNGPAWQVMRLSRNRNWGHPALLAFLERFARKVPTVSHWPGIRRRYVAAARQANAHGPRIASNRSRCRHLADSHAKS